MPSKEKLVAAAMMCLGEARHPYGAGAVRSACRERRERLDRPAGLGVRYGPAECRALRARASMTVLLRPMARMLSRAVRITCVCSADTGDCVARSIVPAKPALGVGLDPPVQCLMSSPLHRADDRPRRSDGPRDRRPVRESCVPGRGGTRSAGGQAEPSWVSFRGRIRRPGLSRRLSRPGVADAEPADGIGRRAGSQNRLAQSDRGPGDRVAVAIQDAAGDRDSLA